MRYFYFIFLSFAYLSTTVAWIQSHQYKNPAYPGKCFYNGRVILSPGDKRRHPNLDMCVGMKCNEDGMITFTGCDVPKVPPNCSGIGQIHTPAPFPQCCDVHWMCRTGNWVSQFTTFKNDW